MNEQMSHEVEAQLRKLMSAPDADAAFVSGLRSRLMANTKLKPSHRFAPRLAWGSAFALVLLVGGLMAFSPQVVAAMRRLLAYIPGVGFVESGPALRVLAEPVTLEKDGLTLTIEKAAADSQRTVLLARVEGDSKERAGAPSCTEPPQLVSEDGTVQHATGSLSSSDVEHDGVVFVRYEFEPMPAQALGATLEVPCLLWDADFRNWSVPLHFQVAEGTDQVLAVIELPTPAAPPAAPNAPASASSESAPAGFSIVLKRAVELEDGYVLSGSYQWSDASLDSMAVAISHSNIVDANGQDVAYQEAPFDPSTAFGPQEIPFAYQITGKDHAWPLNLVVNAISVVQPGEGTFEFDAGPDPQVGQTWNVDLDVPVGQHVVHVEAIQVKSGAPYPPGMVGFEFTMTSDPLVAGAVVHDAIPMDCTNGCGGGGGGGGGGADFGVSGFDTATGPFVNGWVATGYSLAGPKTFVVSDVAVFVKGPWQVSWQPTTP